MKKNLPYIILFLLCLALAFFIYINKSRREMDNEVTFKKNEKRPYGTFVAYQQLRNLFPHSSVSANRQEPGYWDSLSTYDNNQALIILTDNFSASSSELKKLMDFVKEGNDLFITARQFSTAAQNYFDCKIFTGGYFNFPGNKGLYDSLRITLLQPPFKPPVNFVYPGRGVHSYFTDYNAPITEVLGLDDKERPFYIHLQSGKGNIYIHLAPITFTNYFILHKKNIQYFEKIFSVLNPQVKRIVWDEYYLQKRDRQKRAAEKSGWWAVLMRYRAMKAAMLTALFALLLFVFSEMRRKQRIIPVIRKPRNESLDFVKTIGRLYYDRSDHQNLCKKMSGFFLEHVRNRYKIPTNELNQGFVQQLQSKTGIAENEIESLVQFIRTIESTKHISPKQVIAFHNQLESFYKKE